MFSSLTAELFDLTVLSKPYFDRHGLILAFDESNSDQPHTPLGFVHASFGPNETLSDLDPSRGVISQLKVVPGELSAQVAQGLLAAAMEYLQRSGSVETHVGGLFPHSPFYLGLYGGSRVPGVMAEDRMARAALLEFGFVDDDEVALLERKLAGFRATGGRGQTDIRRGYQVKAIQDPMETSWWESCLFSLADRDRFTLVNTAKRELVSSVSFWDMQPMSTEKGGSGRGLYDLSVEPAFRRTGIATYLVSEALKSLHQRGVGHVEVQVRKSDLASLAFFEKLGFEQVACGFQMSKKIQ